MNAATDRDKAIRVLLAKGVCPKDVSCTRVGDFDLDRLRVGWIRGQRRIVFFHLTRPQANTLKQYIGPRQSGFLVKPRLSPGQVRRIVGRG